MNEARSDEEWAATVRELVAAGWRLNKIREVVVRRDVDQDGDPAVWIRVVASGDPSREKPLLDLSDDLRQRMRPDRSFPVISFMSQADARELDAEPA